MALEVSALAQTHKSVWQSVVQTDSQLLRAKQYKITHERTGG